MSRGGGVCHVKGRSVMSKGWVGGVCHVKGKSLTLRGSVMLKGCLSYLRGGGGHVKGRSFMLGGGFLSC